MFGGVYSLQVGFWKGRDGEGREGKGREGIGREGKGREDPTNFFIFEAWLDKCRTNIKFPTFCPHTFDNFLCWMLLNKFKRRKFYISPAHS